MVNFEIDYKAIGKRIRFFRKQQKNTNRTAIMYYSLFHSIYILDFTVA